MSQKNQTLGEFIIENQSSFKYTSGELSRLINSIRLAAQVVNHEVNKAGLVDIIGAAGDTNIQGEDQQKLDVYANNKFIQTMTNRNIVCGIASEEETRRQEIERNRAIEASEIAARESTEKLRIAQDETVNKERISSDRKIRALEIERQQMLEEAEIAANEATQASRIAQEKKLAADRIASEQDVREREIARDRAIDNADIAAKEKTELDRIQQQATLDAERIANQEEVTLKKVASTELTETARTGVAAISRGAT